MKETLLWYNKPAAKWTEALPLGNGRLGAMVWGGIDEEVVSLNEETLWSGYPQRWYNDEALAGLAAARELLRMGRQQEAQHLVETKMAGRWTQSYLPLGRLRCSRTPGPPLTTYRRSLDLSSATALTQGQTETGRWNREAFASAPDHVLVYRFESTEPETWEIRLESDLQGRQNVVPDGVVWSGVAPRFVVPSYLASDSPVEYGSTPSTSGMRYAFRCRIETDGRLEPSETAFLVRGCRTLVLLVAAATSFVDRDTHPFTDGADEQQRVNDVLARIPRGSYGALRQKHEKEYRGFFDRAGLALFSPAPVGAPTDLRLRGVAAGNPDPGLVALSFQYGRYLLISASRPGTQPAPLQGLWNQDVRPPWSGNYTTNINTEMNYWPAEVTNLADCHRPLLDFISDVAQAGQAVALRHYGAGGWTAHHNLDVWAHPIPAGDNGGWFPGSACHLFWPLGGAWLSHHLWEHFCFGQDRAFLADFAWPLLRGAARFGLDWLCETPEGTLTTMPSTSPENRYRDETGASCSVGVGTTSDLSSLRELFSQTHEAARILDLDPDLRDELEHALARLPKLRTTSRGALAEWSEDFEEDEPGHRHFSHLYGLFPGTQIRRDTPVWARAARQSIDQRLAHGGAGTGWSLAWLVCLRARLGDAMQAEASLRRWLSESVFPNLFDLHPTQKGEPGVFQIDGNWGVTAGIAEMLLQSEVDGNLRIVRLLPALPLAWTTGRVWGLRVRGGGEVALWWDQGRLRRVEFRANVAGTWTFCWQDRQETFELAAREKLVLGNELVSL